MVKISKHTIESFTYPVEVIRADIEEGACRDPHRCMERLANQRALDKLLGVGNVARLRIDGAQIKFIYDGFRYYATTPKKAKRSLILFDLNKPVSPHKYKVTAIKGTKIQKVTAERQEQINRARKARIDAGKPDKPAITPTIHERVVGLGAV